MDHLHVDAEGPAVLGDLQRATRVPAGDDTRSRLADPLGFPATELSGDLRFLKVVHACATAAELAVLEVHEGEPGDSPQQIPRLGSDPLPMDEVTGIVIRHRALELAERQLD